MDGTDCETVLRFWTMVTRRRFLVANAAAATQSALGISVPGWRELCSAAESSARKRIAAHSGRDFWNDWPDLLASKMNAARQSRLELLARIENPEQIAERAVSVRAQVWELLGGEPERTSLNAQIMGVIERPTYRVEKILFESMPKVYVTANLYVPKRGRRPYPAILAPLGHSPNGKAARNYQYTFQSLAKKGYMVMTYDPFGQGERIQYLEPGTNHTRFPAVSMEHTYAGRPMVLFGSGFCRYRVWDGVRALDYLMARPETDPHRIGCTGQSGGGTMTMFLAALDPRIHVSVAIEGNFANVAGPYYDPPGSISDAETDVIDSLPRQLDRGDLLASIVPRPLLVCYTQHDEGETYGPRNTEATLEDYRELLRLYEASNAREQIGLFTGNLPHGMDFFSRRAVYGWFNRWLGNHDVGVDEEPYEPISDSGLNVTPTGQVSTSLGGHSVVALNAQAARDVLPASPFFGIDARSASEQVRTDLADLLKLPTDRSSLKAVTLSSNLKRGIGRVDEIQFLAEPGIRIVGWFLAPEDSGSTPPCILYISDGYADSVVAEPGPFDEVIRAGYAVCSIHLRGSGLLSPRPPHGGPIFYQQMDLMERFAWANLILGSSAIGQRVWDILRAIDYLYTRTSVSTVAMVGQETAALAALMAGALDCRVESLFLDRMLMSYLSVVEATAYSLPMEWFTPSILKHFDLVDIVAAVQPRPVWLVNAVDPMGDSLRESVIGEIYALRIPSTDLLRHIRILSTPQSPLVYKEWAAETVSL